MTEYQHRGNPGSGGTGSDQDLRGRFAALRREEEKQVPEFGSLLRPRRRTSGGRVYWLAGAACVLVLLVAVLWQRSTRPRPPEVWVASITQWKAPTDFLLQTPGSELLRGVPEIGAWPGYAVAAPARPAVVRKKISH
jgi:hypothetical protein